MLYKKRGRQIKKLSSEQEDEIFFKFTEGKTMRQLGSEYKVSRETVRKVVNSRPNYVAHVHARRLKTVDMQHFISLIQDGVSPVVAAGSLGYSRYTLDELMMKDANFASEVYKARYNNLAESEKTIDIAAKQDWKPALEKLTRAKETKNEWKDDKPEVAVQFNQLSINELTDRIYKLLSLPST